MAQGIRTRDANGDVLVDISDQLTRIIGMVTTGTSDGSVTDPGLQEGEPFVAVLPPSEAVNYFMPFFEFSGDTMSWSFEDYNPDSLFAGKMSVTALYGVVT